MSDTSYDGLISVAIPVADGVALFDSPVICDYLASYLINYAGCSAVTDMRNQVFDKLLRQGATFSKPILLDA